MIHCGTSTDGYAIMKQAGLKASLVFSDPPFGIDFKYDVHNDKMTDDAYRSFTDQWVSGIGDILCETGSLFVAINDERVCTVKTALESTGLFTFRNWIIWHYTFGPHQKKKFGRDHAHILYYVRDPKRFTFNADDIRIPSIRQKLGDKRADPRGRVPGDVWQFPRIPGNSKERTGHPCQMPVAILERIIRVATNPGELVYDPFMGSGTTAVAAKKLGRRFAGSEISPQYCEQIAKRLASTPQG